MLLFSFDMAASDKSRIDERNTGALPQISHIKGNSKWDTDLSLQLYKSVIGNGMGKSDFMRDRTKR